MQTFIISVLNLESKLSYSIFFRAFIMETNKQKLNFLLRKFCNFQTLFLLRNFKFSFLALFFSKG